MIDFAMLFPFKREVLRSWRNNEKVQIVTFRQQVEGAITGNYVLGIGMHMGVPVTGSG